MRFRLMVGVVCLALLTAPPAASAQGTAGGEPVLRQARVEVNPQPERHAATVDESFVIDGVAPGTPVEHVLATFPGVRISGLRVSVGAAPVPTTTTVGTGADTVAFTAPAHAGPLSYSIAYTVAQGEQEHLPILVPGVPTNGSRVVRLHYNVPDGYHVQGEPFPVVIGSSGHQQRDLIGVPSFLAYQLGREPSSGWSVFSWLGVLIIVLGVAMSAVVIVREARSGRE
jgi:hypothetical protein